MRGELFHFTSQNITNLAVFIMRTDNGTHTGVLHRDRGTLFVLDLLWHEALRSRPCRDEFACVVPNIDEDAKNDVAALCRLINTRQQNPDPTRRYLIPYAFRFGNNVRFNIQSGELMLGDGLGLTCSTFVLAVFESARVPLIDLNGWKERPKDEERHRSLLEQMRSGIPPNILPAEPGHVQRVEKELPCIRVRPEEVAAAGMSDDPPANFYQVEAAGRWILSHLTNGAEQANI